MNTNACAKRCILAFRALELAVTLILGYTYAAWRTDRPTHPRRVWENVGD